MDSVIISVLLNGLLGGISIWTLLEYYSKRTQKTKILKKQGIID